MASAMICLLRLHWSAQAIILLMQGKMTAVEGTLPTPYSIMHKLEDYWIRNILIQRAIIQAVILILLGYVTTLIAFSLVQDK